MCGGTRSRPVFHQLSSGLSPRVRGNQKTASKGGLACGTIPACAGEPNHGPTRSRDGRDYPRVCGGTSSSCWPASGQSGLSPRVRGNPGKIEGILRIEGTIPACAGEPRPQKRCRGPRRDYPRVCGGTRQAGVDVATFEGLSPRVRGNRSASGVQQKLWGTIPACAGEPTGKMPALGTIRDYPRVCGGTISPSPIGRAAKGLSPRVRGNPEGDLAHSPLAGTIPACAGEPSFSTSRNAEKRDYPRVCGGTRQEEVDYIRRVGLSPRVRGNPPEGAAYMVLNGTIPACAGEPSSSTAA